MIVTIPVKFKDEVGKDQEGVLWVNFTGRSEDDEEIIYGGKSSMALVVEKKENNGS
jgi:hypothetical protein